MIRLMLISVIVAYIVALFFMNRMVMLKRNGSAKVLFGILTLILIVVPTAQSTERLFAGGNDEQEIRDLYDIPYGMNHVSVGANESLYGGAGNDVFDITLVAGNRVTLLEPGSGFDRVILRNLAFDDITPVYTRFGLELQSELGTVVLASGWIAHFDEIVFTDKTLHRNEIEALLASALKEQPVPEAIGTLDDR